MSGQRLYNAHLAEEMMELPENMADMQQHPNKVLVSDCNTRNTAFAARKVMSTIIASDNISVSPEFARLLVRWLLCSA